MNPSLRTLISAACLLTGACITTTAQPELGRVVIGSGAVIASGEEVAACGTVGQSAIGQASGLSQDSWLGFWYVAESCHSGFVDAVEARGNTVSIAVRPNPIDGDGTIVLTMQRAGAVSLVTYDVLGQEEQRIVAERLEAGEHRFILNTRDMSSGLRFLRLSLDGEHVTLPIRVVR